MKAGFLATVFVACALQQATASTYPECSMLPNCKGDALILKEMCFLSINCDEDVA